MSPESAGNLAQRYLKSSMSRFFTPLRLRNGMEMA